MDVWSELMVAVAPQDGAGSVFALAPPGDGSWREEALLEASDGADGDAFGSSVSVGDDLALVGAVGESSLGVGAGAAYIFARNATNATDGSGESLRWAEAAKLLAPDGIPGARFGHAVALAGTLAVVSAQPEDADDVPASGAVYVYEQKADVNFSLVASVEPPDSSGSVLFGSSVAASGDAFVV